jgi:ATP-binding cassette subfamily B protein
LADLYNTIQSALAGAERVFDIIDINPRSTTPRCDCMDNIVGDVVFDHVDFEYVPNVPVLQDVSLHAKPGQTIALVGHRGRQDHSSQLAQSLLRHSGWSDPRGWS